jgi:hypothetical protein
MNEMYDYLWVCEVILIKEFKLLELHATKNRIVVNLLINQVEGAEGFTFTETAKSLLIQCI